MNNQSSFESGYSFVESHRLEQLPILIERLEYEINKLEIVLSDSTLYSENPTKFEKVSNAIVERQSKLKSLEDEWFMLEEKADKFGKR